MEDDDEIEVPASLCTVVALQIAIKEAKAVTTDGQYAYLVSLAKRLVSFGDPRELWDMRIKPIDQYFELCAKGNLLGNLNIRLYFKLLDQWNEVVILKSWKKEIEGKTPRHIILNLDDRLEDYVDWKINQHGLQRAPLIYRSM